MKQETNFDNKNKNAKVFGKQDTEERFNKIYEFIHREKLKYLKTNELAKDKKDQSGGLRKALPRKKGKKLDLTLFKGELEPEEIEAKIDAGLKEDDYVTVKNVNDGARFAVGIRNVLGKNGAKILGAIGGVVALAGIGSLIYYLVKQGQADQAQEVIQNTQDARVEAINELKNALSEIANRTDVGDIENTFYTNDDAANNINALNPNQYHQNEIINAVTSDNEILPAHNFGDVADYASEGKDITSIQVGNEFGIDGHVNTFDGEPLKDKIEEYNFFKEGVRVRE